MYFYLAWRNFFEAINFFYNARITKTWLFEAYHNPFLVEIEKQKVKCDITILLT